MLTLRSIHKSIAVLCASCVLVHGPAAYEQVSPPPADLQASAGPRTFHVSADTRTSMSVRFLGDSATRAVYVKTLHKKAGGGELVLEDKYAVRYWPTAVYPLEDRALAVAGLSPRTGNTIIEVWTFSEPQVKSSGGGPVLISLESGKQQSVDDVYDEKTSGRRIVRRLLRHYGTTDRRIIAWFDDSRCLYSVSRDGGALQLLASPTGAPGALTAPFLANVDHALRSGRTTAGPCVYFFGQRAGATRLDPATPQYLIFYDDDCNGTLDRSATLTGAQCEATGLSLESAWVE